MERIAAVGARSLGDLVSESGVPLVSEIYCITFILARSP